MLDIAGSLGTLHAVGSDLRCTCGSTLRVEGHLPDRDAARRSCNHARRLLGVVLREEDGRWSAHLDAVWRRLPHRRAIPVGAALWLGANGVRTEVHRSGSVRRLADVVVS